MTYDSLVNRPILELMNGGMSMTPVLTHPAYLIYYDLKFHVQKIGHEPCCQMVTSRREVPDHRQFTLS